MGQGAGVPARSERLQRGPSVGKVGAGDRRGEHYLSVYLRVPPAPIARRSEPVAGRVATRSGCPLFCCQEGAKRARGIGAWGGQVGTGTAGFPSRMGVVVELQDLLWSPSSPQRRNSIGQALLPSFINSFVHLFLNLYQKGPDHSEMEGSLLSSWGPLRSLTPSPPSSPPLPVAPE